MEVDCANHLPGARATLRDEVWRKLEANLQFKEHKPGPRPRGKASWRETTKPDAIKGRSGKLGQCARKVNVLTWGDLPLNRKIKNPDLSVRLEWQGSAEAMVPSAREGLDNEEG